LKFNTDRIVSLSAMVVGLGSLFTVLYQTHLTRQAQHASVLPYLSIALMANDEGVYVLLNNSGIGPALIDEVRIHRTGRQTVGDPYDFYVASRPDSTLDLAVDKVLPGRLIPAGASIRMLGTGIAQRQKGLEELLGLFEIAEVPRSWYIDAGASGTQKAIIEITFSSVYGDRWRIRSDRMVPERL
jgi:hypothetical protein